MSTESLKEAIKKELPALLREDPALRGFIRDLMRDDYAGRQLTDERFNALIGELRRDREIQAEKWEEQNRKWEEQNRKSDEQNRKSDEQMTVLRDFMAEQKYLWKENNAERERRWEENKREFERVHQEIMALAERHDRSVGALGARWGIQSEATFRNALAGILERHFGVQVLRVDELDETGTVFGRPDRVELDLIVKNGLLIICELKSSIDKAGMYIFERKVRFYEERHGRKADRIMVISPMIDPRARKVAERLGIEMYSDSTDVV